MFRFRRLRLIPFITLFILCLCPIAALGQVIHYQQNFDNLKEGNLDGQDGWAVGPPANQPSTIITSKVKHGQSGKSIEVNASQEVIRNFNPIIKKGTHFLSIWFRFENPGVADNTMHIYIGEVVREWSAGPVIRIGAQSGDPNKVGVHDGNTVKPVGNIKKGEWQHIFGVMDVDNQKYTVSLDDVIIAKNFSWRNPANHHGLGWLMLGFDVGAGLIGYYDDVIFGEGDKLPNLSLEPKDKLAITWSHMKNKI